MPKKECSVKGCTTKHKSLGYCERHYAQFIRTGEIRFCAVIGCNKLANYKSDMCKKHQLQRKKKKEQTRLNELFNLTSFS